MKRCLMLLALWLFADSAAAHKASDSYLTLMRDGPNAITVTGRWDIALRDLDAAMTLDVDGDGDITWGEVRARQSRIADYALSRLAVSSEGNPCPLKVIEQLIDTHSDGAYSVLMLTGACAQPGPTLAIDYRLLFDIDPQHRGLLQFVEGGLTRSVIFGADSGHQNLGVGATGWFDQFKQYVRDGVWHIWLGFDHILFLLSLLLPAVLLRRDGNWIPATNFRSALIEIVKIVTAFTVAHSITLSLATLAVISPNARWVEAGIAVSVVLAATNNVFPLIGRDRWVAAFGFGLVHGLGFANALKDLGLPTSSLVLSLFGFNAGVELGQLAVVSLFLPLAFGLRQTWAYRRVLMSGGSAAIAMIATLWLIERVFNVSLAGVVLN